MPCSGCSRRCRSRSTYPPSTRLSRSTLPRRAPGQRAGAQPGSRPNQQRETIGRWATAASYGCTSEPHRGWARRTPCSARGTVGPSGAPTWPWASSRPTAGCTPQEMLDGLEVVPRRTITYRDATFEEMDLDAVLARRPRVALVDEMAHTNVPGSRNTKRWQDIEELLAAGIDVITTVNIQHLESVNDVVEKITGVRQRETVPDAVVRAADQIELRDMTAEALRRRLAHGNVYAPEKIDAALASYFRGGNLNALRELALLWTADRVEDALQLYREQHDITSTWEARERVVVALTGGPEGETLVRRAARIAARASGGDLLAVHVARSDGLGGANQGALAEQRLLVESLGGTYHQVLGDDVPAALLAFARAENATQLVLGDSRRPTLARLFGPGTATSTIRDSRDIDVHIVTHQHTGRGFALPYGRGSLSSRRRVRGYLLAVVLPIVMTLVLVPFRGELNLVSDMLIFLLVTVVVALVGGLVPALIAAVAGSALLNYYFTPPLHTLSISEANNALALLVFVSVAMLVSSAVDLAARRTRQAARAAAESRTLANLAGSVLAGRRGAAGDARTSPGDLRPHLGHRVGEDRRRLGCAGQRRPALRQPTGRRDRGACWRRAHPGPARAPGRGRGPAAAGCVRRPGRGRGRPDQAQRSGCRGGSPRRGQQDAFRAARGCRPRPAHPARGGQGVGIQPAEQGRQADCSRPPGAAHRSRREPRPAGRPGRQPARHEPAAGRCPAHGPAADCSGRGRRAHVGRPRARRTHGPRRDRRRPSARAVRPRPARAGAGEPGQQRTAILPPRHSHRW